MEFITIILIDLNYRITMFHFNRSKLPSYRLAPDYETAVQRKYSQGDYYNQTPNLIPTTSISHQDINLHQVR